MREILDILHVIDNMIKKIQDAPVNLLHLTAIVVFFEDFLVFLALTNYKITI